MRTIVAGSVCSRLARARTLRRTYSRGCSSIGRMISWRFVLRCSIRTASETLRFAGRTDLDIWRILYLTLRKMGDQKRSTDAARGDGSTPGAVLPLLLGGGSAFRHTGCDDWVQERHHGA